MPQAPAIHHDFQIDLLPAEGSSCLLFNGDFGTSPFF
jgi:hypothetical protein